MAPGRPPAQRRNGPASSQNEHVYELGKVGRKTGITLEDRGIRDEHGMEPIEGLFSSPAKAPAKGRAAEDGSEDEQEMEMDDEEDIGPGTAVRMRQPRERISLPRSRSPMKTHLNSPARHNPHLGPTSSPTRGSLIEDRRDNTPAKVVRRRLDFSLDEGLRAPDQATQSYQAPPSKLNSKLNGSKNKDSALLNGHTMAAAPQRGPRRLQPVPQDEPEEEDEDDGEDDAADDQDGDEEQEEDMEGGNYGDDDDLPPLMDDQPDDYEEELGNEVEEELGEQEEEDEEPPAQIVKQTKKPGSQPAAPEPKKRGRPPKAAAAAHEPPEPVKSPKRSRQAVPAADDEDDEDSVPKRQRTQKESKASSKNASKAKEKGKPGRPKRKSNGDSPQVQRGPPMPRQRGLQIQRQEDLTNDGFTTRSGRSSYKPLGWWKGERAEYDENDALLLQDKGGRHIKLGSKLTGIVRVETPEHEKRAYRRTKTAKRKRTSDVDEEDEGRQEWEADPGRISGECILWYPEHELNPPGGDDEVEVIEEEMAISNAATTTKDIKDATFRFAKTLTLPFFGAGVLDIPPGGEKRPKNSRKMQMVFFVHRGLVQVSVAQTVFTIGKGGQWFVPRGNQYAIENISDRPARVFFAQGCEIFEPPEELEGET